VDDDEHRDPGAHVERHGQRLQRVERAGLRVAQVGDAAEDAAVPQGQVAVPPGLDRVLQVRRGVGDGVEAGQCPPRPQERPRHGQGEQRHHAVFGQQRQPRTPAPRRRPPRRHRVHVPVVASGARWSELRPEGRHERPGRARRRVLGTRRRVLGAGASTGHQPTIVPPVRRTAERCLQLVYAPRWRKSAVVEKRHVGRRA
jgi:hypothetical protein